MADDYEIEVAEHEAIVGRDQEAFARWFARCEIPLKRSLRNYLEIVDIEAVVQDTAILVWQRTTTIKPDGWPGFLLRWAVTVARNSARNQARRLGRLVPLDHEIEMAMSESPNGNLRNDPLLRTRVMSCVTKLSDRLRKVIAMRLADRGERSDQELAKSIDMTFSAFRQNLKRGRDAVKECLNKFGIDVAEYLK